MVTGAAWEILVFRFLKYKGHWLACVSIRHTRLLRLHLDLTHLCWCRPIACRLARWLSHTLALGCHWCRSQGVVGRGWGAGQEVRSKMVVVSYMCHVAWHMGCTRDVGVRQTANMRNHDKHENTWETWENMRNMRKHEKISNMRKHEKTWETWECLMFGFTYCFTL